MSEFSIEALDAAARSVSGNQPTGQGKKKLFGQEVQNINPQLQAEPDVSEVSMFDPRVLDQQAQAVAKMPESKVSGLAGDLFGLKKLGQGLAGLADVTVGGVIPSIAGAATYAGARALGGAQQLYGMATGTPQQGISPEQASKLEQRVVGAIDKPFGKFFGVTETAGYKGEAANQLMNYIGQHINEGAEAIASKTGLPVSDVQNMMNTIMAGVAPEAGRVIGQEAKMIGGAIKEKLPSVRMEKAPPEAAPVQQPIEQMKQQFEQQKAAQQGQPAAPQVNEQGLPTGTAKPVAPDAPYTELNYSEKGLPVDEQLARAQVLQKVLGSDHEVDLSAIEGKGKERATNFDVAKTDTPQGNYIAERIADEKRRLAGYAEGLIKKSGGTVGLDESASYKRGNAILEPFEEFGNLLDKQIEELYKKRNETAKEVPVQANFTKDLLNDDSVIQLGDNEKLAKASTAKMKSLGMMDKKGNLLNTDAYVAEQFRKWLNSPGVWSPQNAGLHRLLKESIDNDVFAHADQAIYQDARALHGLKKDTLDNPKGIATILDESGPNGINRKVDVEKIPNKIAGMGVDQFTHIINTLDNMPESMQPKAQKAKAELKAQFLNQALNLSEKPNKLTTFMNDNKEVMNRLFTPEEMQDIRDYHNASQILKTDIGYKGAAVQKINVEQKLGTKVKEHLLSKGAALASEALTGGATMGAAALVTNEMLEKGFQAKQAKAVAKAEQEAFEKTQQRYHKLEDLLPKNGKKPVKIELRGMANKE